jgi:hypothetical protein
MLAAPVSWLNRIVAEPARHPPPKNNPKRKQGSMESGVAAQRNPARKRSAARKAIFGS